MSRAMRTFAAGVSFFIAGSVFCASGRAEPTPRQASSVPTAPSVSASESTCIATYTGAQESRRRGAYRKAREQLLVCGRDPCAVSIKRDCAAWLEQVESLLPSVVVDIRAPGGEPVVEVRVLLDGALVADHLDGRSIVVDPGVHVFRYEVPGWAPIERKILINEAEKSRRLTVLLEAPAATVTAGSGAPLWPVFVAGGVAAAALGSFAYFGARGVSGYSDLEMCEATPCTASQVDPVHQKLVAADVSLGIAVVSLGVATYFFVRHVRDAQPPKEPPAASTARGAPGAPFVFTF